VLGLGRGLLLGLHGHVGGTEVDGACRELLDAGAGADGLVVDGGSCARSAVILDPLLHDRLGERRACAGDGTGRTVDLGCRGGRVVGRALVVVAAARAGQECRQQDEDDGPPAAS
jgi:hypothetical protein